jgi:hypothetical protein
VGAKGSGSGSQVLGSSVGTAANASSAVCARAETPIDNIKTADRTLTAFTALRLDVMEFPLG